MTIKHDNIIPSTNCGIPTSTGLPNALTGIAVSNATAVGMGTARVLGAIAQAVGGPGSPSFKFYNNSRLLVTSQLPDIDLPPPAKYQVPGNANSTDYACGSQARRRTQEINEPETEFPELPPPTVTLEILGIYASNYSLPLSYNPTLPATELLVGSDFYVNLRIRPSVGLPGLGAGMLDPTIFTLNLNIDGTSYPMPVGFTGWLAGDNASNLAGDFYSFPGSYLGQTGLATLTFTGGQPTINIVFGSDSTTIPVVTTGCVVSANISQQGWFPGVPAAPQQQNTVYAGLPLQLVVNGPVSSPYNYTLPWASGSSTTDSNGMDTLPSFTGQQAGTWNFNVDFYNNVHHVECNNPLNQSFIVLNALTAQPRSTIGWIPPWTPPNVTDTGQSHGGDFDRDPGEGDFATSEVDAGFCAAPVGGYLGGMTTGDNDGEGDGDGGDGDGGDGGDGGGDGGGGGGGAM